MGDSQGWFGLVFSNEVPSQEKLDRIVAGLVIDQLSDTRVSMSGFHGERLPDRAEGEMILDGLEVMRRHLEESLDDSVPAMIPDYAWLERSDDLDASFTIAFDAERENFAFSDEMDDVGWINGCYSIVESMPGLIRLLSGIDDDDGDDGNDDGDDDTDYGGAHGNR